MAKCKCRLQSGKVCPYNTKDGSVYCGRHQNCKTAKQCPSGKEMNPKTNRCIKSCSVNKTRNEKGRCVNTTKKMNKQKMYPICLKFTVNVYDESDDTPEKVYISTFTDELKNVFTDAIKNTFVKSVKDYIGITITDIDIKFKDDNYIIMNGVIPINIDTETLSGASFKDTIEVMDDKSIFQLQYESGKSYISFNNSKKYYLTSVEFCKK